MAAWLSSNEAAALQAAPFTYREVGATATAVPAGYLAVRRSQRLHRRDFPRTAEDLLSWQVQERAGLAVAASSDRAAEGSVVAMRLGLGRVAIKIPCRVVYVVDEADRAGFAYGTLPGHPESGEELFLLEREGSGDLTFTISAFFRPASTLARAGGPVSRWLQQTMTARYLAALDRR